jgi:Zn-dependent protease
VSGPAAYAGVVLYTLPGLFAGLMLHELSHAAIAVRCGDVAARRDGRMSLDPRRQVDAVGVLTLLVAGFGWSQPIVFNAILLRSRGGRAAVAAAGPLSHIIMAAVFAVVLRVEQAASGIDISGFATEAQTTAQGILLGVLLQGFFINIALFVFNALPLPGLDGYAVLRALLFPRLARAFSLLESHRLLVYAAAIAFAIAVPEATHGAVNPLAAMTLGVANVLFSHIVDPGVTPLFLGLPNIFMLLG